MYPLIPTTPLLHHSIPHQPPAPTSSSGSTNPTILIHANPWLMRSATSYTIKYLDITMSDKALDLYIKLTEQLRGAKTTDEGRRQAGIALNSLKYLRYRHLFKALYTKFFFRSALVPLAAPRPVIRRACPPQAGSRRMAGHHTPTEGLPCTHHSIPRQGVITLNSLECLRYHHVL